MFFARLLHSIVIFLFVNLCEINLFKPRDFFLARCFYLTLFVPTKQHFQQQNLLVLLRPWQWTVLHRCPRRFSLYNAHTWRIFQRTFLSKATIVKCKLIQCLSRHYDKPRFWVIQNVWCKKNSALKSHFNSSY